MFTPQSSAPGRPRSNWFPISELRARLRDDAEAATLELLTSLGQPNKKRSTREILRWGRKGALRVHIAGDFKGAWIDESSGEHGDMLKLAIRVLGSKEAAYEWARRRYGDGGSGSTPIYVPTPPDPERVAREAAAEDARRAERRAKARALWERGIPIAGTQTERYLEARRITAVPAGAFIRHLGSVRDSDGKAYPAMMVALTNAHGEVRAVQLTFLCREGSPAKAPNAKSDRETRGAPGDGVVWLTPRGEHCQIFVAEGVESALSAWIANPTMGAVAILGTRHAAASLPPPDVVEQVTIAVDVDPLNTKTGKRPGEDAARGAATAWTEQGYTVRLAFPGPRDGPKCDFNDLLQREGVEAVRAALASAELVGSPARQSVRERIVSYIIAAKISLPRYVREVGRSQ